MTGIASPDTDVAEEMAVLGASLPRAITGVPVGQPRPFADPASGTPEASGRMVEDVLGLQRLIEAGLNGFNLADIGSASIPDFDTLETKLDDLDGTPGNVSYSLDAQGRPTYEVE